MAVWQAASIHGRARGPAGAGVLGGGGQVVHREADVDRPLPRLRARASAGKSGSPSSSTITFTTGPAWRQPSGASDARQRGGAQRVGVGEHHPRRAPPPRPRAPRPTARPSSTSTRSTGLSSRTVRARRLGRGAQRSGHRAHAPARVAPRARHPGRLAEVVVEADERRARVLGAGQRADQALDRERHAHLLRGDVRQLVGHRAVEDPRAHGLQPALAVGRLAHQRPRPLGGPLPALGERRVAVGVGARPVALELGVRALAARTR